MRRYQIVLLGMAAVLFFRPGAAQALPTAGLHLQFLGELPVPTLPSGVVFGGGGNSFERRVDVSGTLAVVGAGKFRQGADQGYAFVYDFSDPSNIRQIATLRASDNAAGNEFGDGVAISGNQVFVGARGDSNDRGAVYMYDVSDPNHVVERKIRAFDGLADDEFGFSLAADGNRLIVGAPKFSAFSMSPASAYIVDFTNPSAIQQTRINSHLPGLGGGYGQSVDISGNYAIVGHPDDSAGLFPFAGSAHLYDLTNLNAIQEKKLNAIDAPNYNNFGERVTISGHKALVSVTSDPGPTNNAGTPDGAVWAVDFSDWNHISQHEFGRPVPMFGGPISPFGRWLELQGNLGVAAAFNEDNARGALYFYDVSNVQNPVQLLRVPSQSASDNAFGIAFAIDGSTLMVSDSGGDVYLYRMVPEPAGLGVMLAAFSAAAVLGRRRAERDGNHLLCGRS